MTEKLAPIKPYYKFEMAELYRVSRKKFMYWINGFDQFKKRLLKTGYYNSQHIFTVKQVEIIFEYLGHPDHLSEEYMQDNPTKVTIRPYSKKELATIYDISMRSLMNQIRSIPDKKVYHRIMQSETNPFVVEVSRDKRLFMKEEVQLIFKFLGHPYKQQNEQNNEK